MNIKTQRGFIGIRALVAIVLGLIVVGGGAYFMMHQNVAPVAQPNYPDLSTLPQTQQQQPSNTAVQATTNNVATTPAPATAPASTQTQGTTNTNTTTSAPKSYCTADNYSVKDGVEYWGANPLKQADPATFKTLPPFPQDGGFDLCLAEDATHIFVSRNLVLPRPDHITYLPLQGSKLCNAYRVVDGLGVFWGVWLLSGADPKTFVDITGTLGHGSPNDGTCYGKDANTVYINQNQISKDTTSFSVLYDRYSKDSQNVYYSGKPISGADPKTFTALYFWWAKDANHAYQTDQIIKGADPSTFVMLDDNHSKDALHVYNFFGQLYAGLDAKTAVSIDGGVWLKDASHIYWGDGTVVPLADAQTFVGLGGGYGKDAYHVFYNTGEIFGSAGSTVDGADLATFTVANGYAKDATHIFSAGKILPNANVATFARIGNSSYYKDATRVWVGGETGGLSPIAGADPSTFVLTDTYGGAKDANHTYGFDAKGRFYTSGQ